MFAIALIAMFVILAFGIINRDGAEALIPEEVSDQIFQDTAKESTCLTMMRRLPNMARGTERLPVLSALPTAYFVNGEAGDQLPNGDPAPGQGWKQTTQAAWANKYLYVGEVACIVPIPEAVLDDADYDIWGQVRPLIGQAMGQAVDGAILYGTNKPASWPSGIVTQATAAGNVVVAGAAVGADCYDDLLGEDGVWAKIEACGYNVNGWIGAIKMKSTLRGLRDSTGQPIFQRTPQDGTRYALDGVTGTFPENGAIDPTSSLIIAGAFNQAVFAMRQDITTRILTEAVIQNPADGRIIYNLAQQDMVALRVYMRLAWQIPNPINAMQAVEANRCAFAIYTPAPAPPEGG